MRAIRVVIAGSYAVLMILGGLLATVVVVEAVQHYRTDTDGWRYIVQYGGPGSGLLVMTLAYTYVFLRKGSNYFAPLVYCLNYGLVGFFLSSWMVTEGKETPPISALLLCVEVLIVTVVIATPGFLFNYGLSSWSDIRKLPVQ